MRHGPLDTEFFIPAATVGEAVSRIFSVTGANHRSRGEKRALVALRDALVLDVDVTRTNAVMGERIAEALGVEWNRGLVTDRNKVNLLGLNLLLEGATERYQEGALRRLATSVPESLAGAEWSTFTPAVSKIEAVTRIAALTDAPAEWLGPGSKEHKSVLVNLADRLLPAADVDRSSKTRLGRDIAGELGVQWTDTCYSTGETISLEGLNVVLAGAERRLGRLGVTTADLLSTAEQEATALVAALLDGWKAEMWDGRTCVQWLDDNKARGANDNEWQGWYFEARGREILNAAFQPGRHPVRTRYGHTTFDYSLNRVWDLKAHTETQTFPVSDRTQRQRRALILNDERAIRQCIAEQGLGFLVLGGEATMDEDGSFVQWHRDFKLERGVVAAASNSGRSRIRKAGFRPLRVDGYWIEDESALSVALLGGLVGVRPIGRQPPKAEGLSGTPRADKMELRPTARGSVLHLADRAWVYR